MEIPPIVRGWRQFTACTGYSKTQGQQLIKAGKVPAPAELTPGGHGIIWSGAEIEEHNKARFEARDEALAAGTPKRPALRPKKKKTTVRLERRR
jgi:hypothetical protein